MRRRFKVVRLSYSAGKRTSLKYSSLATNSSKNLRMPRKCKSPFRSQAKIVTNHKKLTIIFRLCSKDRIE